MRYPIALILLSLTFIFSSINTPKEALSTETNSSENTFTNITVTSPSGGQDYCFKRPQAITWLTTGGTVSTVSIHLMHPNGQTINTTIANNIANTGSHLWDGMATGLGNYRIKISGNDDATPAMVTGQTGVFTLKNCDKPDLQVGALQVIPNSPGEGQVVRFIGKVMNNGDAPVVNPVVTMKVKRPAGLATQTFTKEIERTLDKNQAYDFLKEFRVRKPGNYTITFIMDEANAVDELYENNNEKDITFPVHGLPDLIVCMSNGKRPPVGRSREIRMVVKNIGSGSTNPDTGIKLRSYVKAKGVKHYDIPPLAPGATHTIKRNHSWGLAGTKSLSARIIYTDTEVKTNNNEVQGSFFVRLPHHDYYSADPRIKCSTGQTMYDWDDMDM